MLETVRVAVGDLLEENAAGLSPKEIADRMVCSLSLLYSWADLGEGGADIPLKRLKQLTLITGDGRVVAAFAAEAGYFAIPIPALGPVGEIEPESVRALHEFSDFMKENTRAFIDKVISALELKKIEKEGYEAMLAIARVIAVARMQRRRGKA